MIEEHLKTFQPIYKPLFAGRAIMSDFPYPTHIEIIRTFAKVLGVKAGNKKLDDKAKDKNADYRLVNKFSSNIFYYISEKFGSDISSYLEQGFSLFLKEYMAHVSNTYADGLSRSEVGAALCKTLLSTSLVNTIESMMSVLSGRKPSVVVFFSAQESCTSQIIDWIEEYELGWKHYYCNLVKENKAKVKAWQEGEHIPDVQSLSSIQSWSKGPWPEQIDWQKVRVLLFIASIIDRAVKEEGASLLFEECRVLSWGANSTNNFSQLVHSHQQDYKARISHLLPLIGDIQQGLKRTVVKGEGQFEYFKAQLAKLEKLHSKEGHKSHFDYWVQWHKARMYVFNGQLQEASVFYQLAFEGSLFRAGINQKFIAEEAIVVAACQEKPDKVFLKHLKNALLMFNYDIPSVQSEKSSIRFSDIIEDWEVQNWRSSFNRVFPKEGMFPEADIPDIKANIGLNIVTGIDEITPDYRHPNRKLKIGERWKKTYPQLVWFSEVENEEVVRRLLTEGANVNMTSSSGDSAILMALEALNVKAIPYRSLDEGLFNLLSQYPHSEETMNLATSKRRLLPLISAVESGKLHIVEKVLKMGADVNVRGATDSQTALNVSLKLIGILKQPQKFLTEQINMEHTPEVLDSIRRNSAGLTGFTLEDQAQHLNVQDTSAMFQRFMEIAMQLIMERVEEKLNLSELRQISAILIDGNSDVNAEHKSPAEGYTPLMLAAELDEVDLFNKMLSSGGDPRKTYYCKNTKEDVDCWRIADNFSSFNVLSALKDIERFFPEASKPRSYH